MNLGDVLHGLGTGQLKGHTWTDSILKTLNSALPIPVPLTEESTGMDTLNAINVLPEDAREHLLSSEVDMYSGTLTVTTTTGDVTDAELKRVDKYHRAVLSAMMKDPKKTIITTLGAVITLALVVVIVVMVSNEVIPGRTVKDTGIFNTLFNALLELIRTFNQ